MKLYVKAYSSYIDDESIDIKKTLKQKYKLDTRRQDRFIHLAQYGGQLLKQNISIEADDELYVTSGVGNIDVVQKSNTDIYEKNESLKLFDFINLLGNTTSYYVAKSMGIKGKNIFQISDNFTYINTLISIYASLLNSKKNAIICTIDLVSKPSEIIKRVLGVDASVTVVSNVNYQKLSLNKKGAIATIEFEVKSHSFDEVKKILMTNKDKVKVSQRCKKLDLKKEEFFFENMSSYYVNEAIKNSENTIYIDCFRDKYKIVKIYKSEE